MVTQACIPKREMFGLSCLDRRSLSSDLKKWRAREAAFIYALRQHKSRFSAINRLAHHCCVSTGRFVIPSVIPSVILA